MPGCEITEAKPATAADAEPEDDAAESAEENCVASAEGPGQQDCNFQEPPKASADRTPGPQIRERHSHGLLC